MSEKDFKFGFYVFILSTSALQVFQILSLL